MTSRELVSTVPRVQARYLLEHGARPNVYAATEEPQYEQVSCVRENAARRRCIGHGLPDLNSVTILQTREGECWAIADPLAVQPSDLC